MASSPVAAEAAVATSAEDEDPHPTLARAAPLGALSLPPSGLVGAGTRRCDDLIAEAAVVVA